MQAIEPAPCLVNRLADVVSGETPVLQQGIILKGVVRLGEGHCPGIEPAVNHLRYAFHLTSALRALKAYFVDKGAVEFQGFFISGNSILRFQILDATNTVKFTARLTLPYG